MKFKTALCALLASLAASFCGCKTDNQIQVIQPQTVVTNSIPAQAFNDERYVWEGFIFSTNQVKSADQK